MSKLLVSGMVVAALAGIPSGAAADDAPPATLAPRVAQTISRAWTADVAPETIRPTPSTPSRAVLQGAAARTPAGPNIGNVGLGGLGGLTDFEIGPSFRFWATDRIGVQAHLGFSGEDFGPEDVEYLRFEPTVIVAIGDFGEGSVNIRPYAGGGIRVVRTDIGRFDDAQVKPVVVGGVEFGFRSVPRLNVSAELSIAPDIDDDDFELGGRVPDVRGARAALLAHYFF